MLAFSPKKQIPNLRKYKSNDEPFYFTVDLMRRAIKAALLSGVLGAGSGHLFLKRYRRGAILIVSTLCALLVIATQAVKQAQVIFEKITPESGNMTFEELSTLVEKTSTPEELFLTNAATMLIMLIWTFGVFDAYKIGKEQDNKKSADSEQNTP